MKTAQDWIEFYRLTSPYRAVIKTDLEPIQLDAFKAGMQYAALVIMPTNHPNKNLNTWPESKKILECMNQLTAIPASAMS